MRQNGLMLAAGRAPSKKHKRKTNSRNLAALKAHQRNRRIPANATESRGRANMNMSSVSLYALASVGPGFEESSLVQTSLSVI